MQLIRLTDIDLRDSEGRRTPADTLRSWVRRGVYGVTLQAVRRGGRWYTSAEWLAEFEERLTAAALVQVVTQQRTLDAVTSEDWQEALRTEYGIVLEPTAAKETKS
jgi:hypothetical protein